jgi:glutathione synthase/RimK-type ligase-like ATP-grasp enzyme
VRVLVTSSRMPFALGMVRELAGAGHEVHAADDYALSPGNHSKYLEGHHVYPSPSAETEAFVDELERIAREAQIDAIVPAFEEAFYISTQRDRLSEAATVFTAPFAMLAPLHDKVAFQRLVSGLGLPIAETVVATSDAELAEATGRFERYFARPAFSRGGVSLLTNTGPLAGSVAITDCHPTAQSPWLVQPFVDGETVCTYSTVHDGRVSSHLMYRIPRQWHHSTGIEFESIDASESLRLIEPIVAKLGYTGQISFDFIVTDDGLSFVECNPRATDGLLLLPHGELARGLLDPEADTFLMPPGHTVALDLAVLADGFSDRLRRLPESIRDLARVHDSGDGWHDPLPTLYSTLAVAHYAGDSMKEHEKLFVAMAGDMNWDGEPIKGMSESDAALLAELTGAS